MTLHRLMAALVTTLCAVAVSCSRISDVDGGFMRFALSMHGEDGMISTKAAGAPLVGATTATLSTVATVRVQGTKNGGNITRPNNELALDGTSGLWYVSGHSTDAWTSGASYVLYANAIAPKSPPAGSITVTSPTQITVNQPATYTYGSEASQFVDYMLSYKFNVPNGASQPVVQIELEHALAMVEIYMVKGNHVSSEVVLESMTLRNISRTSTMKCDVHRDYGSDQRNVWSITAAGSQDTDYSFTRSFNIGSKTGGYEVKAASERNTTPSRMVFMAVPQMLTVDKKVQLQVVYWANEGSDGEDNYVRHEDTFTLDDGGRATEWESGHRYIYTATIDTGITLDAVVTDWMPVDYIEGTVLPAIPED